MNTVPISMTTYNHAKLMVNNHDKGIRQWPRTQYNAFISLIALAEMGLEAPAPLHLIVNATITAYETTG